MFHYELLFQVYMYNFVYVNLETMVEKDYFLDTKTFSANYKIMSTPVPFPKHWLGFSYIRS